MRIPARQVSHPSTTPSFRNNLRPMTRPSNPSTANVQASVRRTSFVLTAQQIKNLREHKYSSEGVTLLDPFMQKFWTRLVEYCPLWVAPNLLTIIGLAINIATSVWLMIATDGAREQCTAWLYLFTGIGLFIYQSLDAIDGKQARRTNSSSPLGELFDHGCDSVSSVFVTIAACCAVQLGQHPWMMFWCFMFSNLAFYCAHWQTYVSGKLCFGKLDCTEAQFTFFMIYLISIIAPDVWSAMIPILDIEARLVMGLLAILSAAWSSVNNMYKISQGGCGRNCSSIAGTSILFPIWPIGFLVFLAYWASSSVTSHALEDHTILHLLCYGLAFSKITNRLIVAHMSMSSLNTWDSAYIGPVAACVNQYFNCLINEDYFVWCFFAYNLFDALRYNIRVCRELCDALNIRCFQINPSPPPPPPSSSSTATTTKPTSGNIH